MKKEKMYCNICHEECEYTILQKEDAEFVAWENSHVEAWGSSHVVARENSHVVARGSSHVVAWENSHVEARENSHVVAWGSSHVVARGSSHVVAWGSSHVVAWENSHVVARENSHVVARGSSHVVAWENSHVEARENSHVVAWGSSHVVARENSHVVATSPYVTTTIKSKDSQVYGGIQVGMRIIPTREWLEKCGVPIKRGFATLFKSVNKDFTTKNGVSFKPQTRHEAPDWDNSFIEECGKGIHYCPTVAQARAFRDEGVYVACRVKVSDMANLPAFAEYPDKIRAKGGYTLYQVDKNGKELV